MHRSRRLVVPLALAAALVVGAHAATTKNVDLLKTFRTQLPKTKQATTVPILLPRTLPLAGLGLKLYATGGGARDAWNLELAAAPRCASANACFVASFEGLRGGKLPRQANLRLAAGSPAYYHPVTCGASCSPASLWFVHRGVLYSWQVKGLAPNARPILARLANEAIAAGPR